MCWRRRDGRAERERSADIGILYSLGIEDFEHLFGGLAAWTVPAGGGRDVRYINIKSVWQIPYKSFDPAKGTIEDATLAVKVARATRGKIRVDTDAHRLRHCAHSDEQHQATQRCSTSARGVHHVQNSSDQDRSDL
jgi:hypothetical protein